MKSKKIKSRSIEGGRHGLKLYSEVTWQLRFCQKEEAASTHNSYLKQGAVFSYQEEQHIIFPVTAG